MAAFLRRIRPLLIILALDAALAAATLAFLLQDTGRAGSGIPPQAERSK